MFEDLRILVSGDYNAFKEGFKGAGVYAVSGLCPSSVEIPIYIGSSVAIESRIPKGHIGGVRQNVHTNKPLQHYYNKNSKENIVYFLLESCEKNQETCLKLEQKYLDLYGVVGDNKSFNILKEAGTLRGAKRSVWTEERRKEWSIRMKIIASTKGRKHTDEAKRKIGDKSRGRKFSEEAKAKMSKSHLGRVHSPEARAKMSASSMGRIISPEARRATGEGNAKSFAVLNKNTGFVHDFFNMREFCREYNLDRRSLLRTRYIKRQVKYYKGWVLMPKGF